MADVQLNNNMDEPKVDDGNNPEELERNSSILAGLNLALILCSLTSSDEEEIQSLEEREIKIGEGRGRIKKNIGWKSKRMQVNEFRAAEREKAKKADRGNAKIKKDCRHGRKM